MTATPASVAPERVPTVLAVLVVRDAADRLRECLQALAGQTYPRLGILAVDDASVDGSHEMLVAALGEDRVIRHEMRLGFARSLDEMLSHPAAGAADHLLVLHDDAVLDPEAVARLVEATQLPGVDRVGIVGAKIVDGDEPRRLRDVGRSADRFGHPYTPLQADEIDQGQFDRVLEVLAVDSCTMLVAREVWQTVGLFDERLGDGDGDVDLGWRARVAGWRVLMTPLARVRHRAVGERDERPGIERSRRYEEDRAALASVLKNYGPVSLLWIVPVGVVLSLVRVVFLVLSRRFEEGMDLAAAVGWNLAHLPGTWRRRRRVQRVRRVRDRQLRRFHESAGLRIPRWFQTAEQILEEQRELEHDEEGQPAARRLRHRTASLFSTHPVLVTASFAVIVGAIAFRHLFEPATLAGGVLPVFPASPGAFFHELTSGVRTTGLGGPLAPTPAVGLLGGLSAALFGSTSLAQKLVLAAGPVLAGVLAYRAAVRLTGRPGPSALAAAAYALSAIVLWSYSEGRIGLLVVLAALPAILERFEVAFTYETPVDGWWRFVAGVGVTLALAVAFEPGVLLGVAVLLIVFLVAASRRLPGLGRLAVASVAAAVLLFPFVPTIVAGGGESLRSQIGSQDPWSILRLALGPAPGSWVPALFLPIAAAIGLAAASGHRRGPASRAGLVAVASLGLAWASAAGYLPAPLQNAPVYAATAAAASALLVALGLASVLGSLGTESFGFRQVAAAAVGVSLTLGFVLQTAAVATGEWGVGGPDEIPAAWAVVDSAAQGEFRVLWLAPDDGSPFPAPGGDPDAVAVAGDATLAYGLTDRRGSLALDIGRPIAGPGADALAATIGEVLRGTTVHGGALLAPFAVRFVVAREDAVPAAGLARLDAQTDLNRIPAAGLVIWRNDAAIPPASVLTVDQEAARIVASANPAQIQRWRAQPASPLTPTDDGFAGPTDGGTLAVLSDEYDGAWEVEGSTADPDRAFGWATSFEVTGAQVAIRYGAGLPRVIAAWLLGACWLAALWITRKPVSR
ncbi:MAG TPA: glycosyltransferase family 2 protein [Actinomycetota bacterium]